MKNVVFLFSKDCMSLEQLPCYGKNISGAKYWQGKTPNIDELFAKGTVFYKHYSAAASTSMSMSAMLSGHYPHEFKSRKRYVSVKPNEFRSIFDDFQEQGYECHILWDYRWMTMAWRFVREFGDGSKTIIHNVEIGQPAGGHKSDTNRLERNEDLLARTYKLIYDELDSIDLSKKQFIWVHLPHVLFGRRSYMDDMDVLDNIVGHVRKMVGDDSIYFTTDHGHMNMHKNKVCYGFDVYEPIIHIPLITPRINGLERWDKLTSNIDLPSIILKGKIPEHDYVISETKYYLQPGRKVAITGPRFKLIYNAADKKEELYDLEWDPEENYNILVETYYDYDRKKQIVYDELYFYPFREEAMEAYKMLKMHLDEMWYETSSKEKAFIYLKEKLMLLKAFLIKWHIIKKAKGDNSKYLNKTATYE